MKEGPKDDFKQYNTSNHYILYSESENSFKCKEHPDLHLVNKGTATRHCKTSHQMDLEGNLVPKDRLEISKSTESESDLEIKDTDTDEIKELKMLLKKKKQGEEEELNGTSPETMMVLDNIEKDIALGATKIAKNIYCRFLYAETKRMFPPDWDFEQWLTFHLVSSLKSWGIGYSVGQDISVLSEEQLLALKAAREDWQMKLKEI